MDFIGHRAELEQLAVMRRRAFEEGALMTVVTGMRGVGKTQLILESCKASAEQVFRLFINRACDAMLCRDLFEKLQSEQHFLQLSPAPSSLAALFEQLFAAGTEHRFTLVIERFEELSQVKAGLLPELARLWSKYRALAHIHLIVEVSEPQASKIFDSPRGAFFELADCQIHLKPFGCRELKELLYTIKPNYSADELLNLFAVSGGLPGIACDLASSGCLNAQEILSAAFDRHSYVAMQGLTRLAFAGGRRLIYKTILEACACGADTAAKLAEQFGTPVNGYLKRLEQDYGLLRSTRSLCAAEASQTVRWEVSDLFLAFFLRFVIRHEAELTWPGCTPELMLRCLEDFERWRFACFKKLAALWLMESGAYGQAGPWQPHSRAAKRGVEGLDLLALKSGGSGAAFELCLRRRQSPLTDRAVKVYKAQQCSELKELHLELHSLCLEDLLD
ncbi:MAG: ATP-binding protein [Proteobacteria bacterium]|uniref:ATP-binding protein n=1 Tax=Candidatus Avisuccinivibrio stercorigallinarum TaxID=2840704 RepID=A0A9D9DCI3_9GAMM|nr:ATP-binding protein [Candidatus Avisuccinivibrio stercorigallinarum]